MNKSAINQLAGIILIAAGGIVGWLGWEEKQSVGSQLSTLVHGAPTDKAVLMMGIGAVLAVVGLLVVGRSLRR